MKKQRPTLQTIAEIAGLSKSAVSRALRNDPMQSIKTCERVQKIAADIGYAANPVINALMSDLRTGRQGRRTATIAVIDFWNKKGGWKTWPNLTIFLEGIKEQIDEFNLAYDYFWYWEQDLTPRRLNQIIQTRGIVGMIILPVESPDTTIELDLSRYALATMGYSLKKPNIHRSARNFIGDIFNALEMLRQRGFKKIGLVEPADVEERNNYFWSAGFYTFDLSAADSGHVPILRSSNYHRPELREQAYQEFSCWYREHKPDVVVGSNLHVLKFIERMGLKVPRDVAYFDLDLLEDDGKVDGVYFDWSRVGAATVDMVIDQINRNERGVPRDPKLTLINGQIVTGKTLP